MPPREHRSSLARAPVLTPARTWIPRFLDASPAFAPLRTAGAALAEIGDFPEVDDYAPLFAPQGLSTASGATVRFVVQDDERRRRAPTSLSDLYDGRIFERGEIPTRPRSFHDLFNALVWASFPRAKQALNALQYHALAARLPRRFTSLPGARTREQDALAMLDEGGILLVCARQREPEVTRAHDAGDAARLSSLVRGGEVRVLVFGHALYEHLVSSTVPVRGRGVVLRAEAFPPDSEGCRVLADALLAELLERRFPGDENAPALPLELATIERGT